MMVLALSRSPAPLYRATMAVAPTFMAIKTVWSRNLGCVLNPTEVMAQGPSWPTIIRSTMDVSWARVSSISDGQAICTMSRYSIFAVTPSGTDDVTWDWSVRSMPGST